jgi:hypothetical protein
VESVNQNGATITGYYAILSSSAGKHISTGYTTKAFTDVTAGTNYEITLDSYASCTFEHWQDTGSTTNPRTFTQANGPMTLVGVYDCTSSSASVAQPVSIGLVMSAVMSEFGMPIGFLVLAVGAFAAARTTVRIVQHNVETA